MFSGFQHSGYQNNAYQIVPLQQQVGGGGRTYNYDYANLYERTKAEYYERKRLEDKKAEIKAESEDKEKQISELELRRLRKLDDYRMQMELIALLKEQNYLLGELQSLERRLFFYRQQQNAILAILLSSPFWYITFDNNANCIII